MQKKSDKTNEDSVMIDSPVEETPVVKKPEVKTATEVDVVAETKRILDASPHVDFIIPPAEGDPKGAAETVQINGYKLTIMKGVKVNIPEAVANLLAEKYRINMMAGSDSVVNRRADIQEALS